MTAVTLVPLLSLPLAKSAQQLGKVGAGCWERALQADCAHIEVDCGQLVLPAGLQDGNLVVGLPRRWS